ncbi:tRNA-dependent cyclodipeptide synthase [Streptomyces sp. NPDC048281]|uniref:tRNA-dependent cyclodipeptide synthase n=1 Tax=Streptomyces sp. NPDC048281 TaxID=3154715 RepID=UPI003424F281
MSRAATAPGPSPPSTTATRVCVCTFTPRAPFFSSAVVYTGTVFGPRGRIPSLSSRSSRISGGCPPLPRRVPANIRRPLPPSPRRGLAWASPHRHNQGTRPGRDARGGGYPPRPRHPPGEARRKAVKSVRGVRAKVRNAAAAADPDGARLCWQPMSRFRADAAYQEIHSRSWRQLDEDDDFRALPMAELLYGRGAGLRASRNQGHAIVTPAAPPHTANSK